MASEVLSRCFLSNRFWLARSIKVCQRSALHGQRTRYQIIPLRKYTIQSGPQTVPTNRCLLSRHSSIIPSCRSYSTDQQSQADRGRVVYEGTIGGTVKGVKAFSLFTSAIGVGLQPYVWTHVGNELQNKLIVASVLGFSILCMPVLLHFITKRYVTQLYWNEPKGEFTAETITFFLRKKLHTFKVEQAEMAEMSGIFTSFTAEGRSYFIDSNSFQDREAYIALMGLDKPFEWELPEKKDE